MQRLPLAVFVLLSMTAPAMAQNGQYAFDSLFQKITVGERTWYSQVLQPVNGNCLTSYKVNRLASGRNQSYVDNNFMLTDADFQSLNAKDLLLYAMNHPEERVNMNMKISPPDNWPTLTFAYIAPTMQGRRISKRQMDALEAKRDSVVQFLKNCMPYFPVLTKSYKELVISLHATECIPELLYKANRPYYYDTYVVTVIMNLMVDARYKPFIQSDVYKKLYGKELNYSSFIESDKKTIDFILQTAAAFYKSKYNH
ncbi:MAG: hypothetical protein H6585_07695 [Flavobacteriales bacterium]|nr:hypothetical protein [Flavobacteriales bacterium]MCB9448209.1 hypothetical protein [Flavobacteriales bacterium]